jgi:hypothetical protein
MNDEPRDMSKLPLNGTKTHPLSDHAKEVLRKLQNGPIPRGSLNPGVANRLEREDLVRTIWKQSPFDRRKGTIRFLEITDAGHAAVGRRRP